MPTYGGTANSTQWNTPKSYTDAQSNVVSLTDYTYFAIANTLEKYTAYVGATIAAPTESHVWKIDTTNPQVGSFLYDLNGNPIDVRQSYYKVGQTVDGAYPSYSHFLTDRYIILEDATSDYFDLTAFKFKIPNIYRIGDVDGALKIKEVYTNLDATGLTWSIPSTTTTAAPTTTTTTLCPTDQDYYNDNTKWGEKQFVLLKDIVNNFMAFYVGDEKIINDVSRFDVVFHAKRGLQELHYDALKDVKALELELPDDLQMELPKDFVKLVRLSWVDSRGRLHPIMQDTQSTIAKAYLQDDDYNIIFDNTGAATEGTSVIDTNMIAISNETEADDLEFEFFGGRFGMSTDQSTSNGKYSIDKNLGYIRFSSDVKNRPVVMEYITDGLDCLGEEELKVNKLAEDYLYKYIAHQVIQFKFGVQEYIVRRLKNEAFAALKNMKIRMMDIHPYDLAQAAKGRNKWIK